MNDVDLRDDYDAPDKEFVETKTETVDLYLANHGKQARTGGPYLDDVERHNAETWRAQREDREPDYENPPLTAGSVLVPKSQLVERDTDKSHLTDNVDVTNEPYTTVEVEVPSTEADPTQVDWDNDSDKLKGLEAKRILGNTPPVAPPVAEDFTGVEDAGDHTDTSKTGNDWDINGPGVTGDVKQ